VFNRPYTSDKKVVGVFDTGCAASIAITFSEIQQDSRYHIGRKQRQPLKYLFDLKVGKR
jgi:hypothetical protein